ncbi:MAG: hypothetical protein K9G67_14150 [Bacteroidales bacterium]|nr:hypothetical protein [Bacteroidales bacterium]MCF8345003.1 hypothetical protein [Bacteroidales bacterium]MCF8352066.1 hypothetical protein [Bacteroidales bacterium]MCF8377495.1 hypothetical protein [Bacteroidales bacterium]MCF8401618.1 hypothetical protein [Bacteroidales bacterium]
MAEFKSEQKTINRSAAYIYNFLSDFTNFEHLMPEQITNWQATENNCSFTIQGMADVAMRMEEKIPGKKVYVVSEGKVPFEFDMTFKLDEEKDNNTKVNLMINASINPMMVMMVKRPLSNLVNIMVDKLKEHMEG